eukprot:symbB.v1.2.029958.t1/scaffold3328.1/size58959/3
MPKRPNGTAMRLSMVYERNWVTSSGEPKNDDLRDHHRFIGSVMRLEPPQLFRGRGEHPKQGLLKKRTFPESVTLNIGETACVPKVCGMPGHAWRDIVHENTVQWIAMFEDGLLQDSKYVSFAATSGLKGQPDMLKYDRARRLVSKIDEIRDSYQKMMKSKKILERQMATATYFIDKLALRVGGEKDTEEEADTVGCCSLRVEHLTLTEPLTIHLDFLGKDSIRYSNSVEVTKEVFDNVKNFINGKSKTAQVFDKIAPTDLNEYFKNFMDDLSAKVFRTYNASFTLQAELNRFDVKKSLTQDQLYQFYNDANRQVAILCNHQKAESKTHAQSMEKLKTQEKEIERNYKTLKKHLHALQEGKTIKDHLKLQPLSLESLDLCLPASEDNASTKMPKDAVATRKKMAEVKVRLTRHRTNIETKEANKTVSLGTSKVNYMDPRITVAWCKKVDLAIEKVFPKTIRTKFPWAMHFPSSYVFQ